MISVIIILSAFALSCNSGTLNTSDLDGGCDGAACTDACADGGCDGGVDPCLSIDCPTGQVCQDGRCRTPNLCADVVCENPGEVCNPADGACHSGAADDDRDGYTIADGDCDDGDPSIHPDALEPCDGVDNDCNYDVDDGFPDDDGDGFDTCGFGNPAQADCDDSNAARNPGLSEACDGLDNDCDELVDEDLAPRPCTTECGEGEESCSGGSWVCSAPSECDCTPAGHVEEEACGYCGTRTRTCESTLEWSLWSSCSGEGVCASGDTETRACGDCGTQSRTCSAECAWGSWSTCAGEGECSAGSVDSQTCGDCGVQQRLCGSDCDWGSWSSCTGEGPCSPGESESRGCGDCGTQSHSCTSSCEWGSWSTCSGEGVCSPGESESRSCGDCGTQSHSCTSSCGWGSWNTCSGEGPCSPGATGSCTTSCGSTGSWSCSASCTWGSCNPPSETCNNVDDDCDGTIDDGFRAEYLSTTFSTLESEHPGCDGSSPVVSLTCNAAIHRYCRDRACTQSGFGPVGWLSGTAWLGCVAGAEVRSTSYTELSSHQPPCDGTSERLGPNCSAAIHRYCRDLGFVSGFGPVENLGDYASVTCVEGAEVVLTSYTVLRTHHSGCNGTTLRWGGDCHTAVSRFCRDRGQVSGFGPVENSGDSAWVTCVTE